MTRERLASGAPAPRPGEAPAPAAEGDDERLIRSLRPKRLDECIGQTRVISALKIGLQAARERGDALDHVLLHGPPGLGKTTFANVIATEMAAGIVTTSGPALERGGDLMGILTNLNRGDVLFIDEVHRLPRAVEEFLYPAMEDFCVNFVIEKGAHARSLRYTLRPFTLVGATTRAGLLSSPLRDRFGITLHLDFYPVEELTRVVHRSASILGVAVTDDGAAEIAREALEFEGVDSLGLDAQDREVLRTVIQVYGGGPVGIEALAATLNEEVDSLVEMVEPYLLKIGFLTRTQAGRRVTPQAAQHLGLAVPERGGRGQGQGALFS